MTKDFLNLIRRVEAEEMSFNVESALKGGSGSGSPEDGAEPQMLDACSNLGICSNSFLCDLDPDWFRCFANTDACGPVVNPKLQLTCRTE